MDFFMIVSLLGGLALFLYGMSMLGSGLEKLSSGRLEQTLEKLTNNVFKGVLLGALVTGAIQSSSATTVIVVGLVNARDPQAPAGHRRHHGRQHRYHHHLAHPAAFGSEFG